MMSRKMRAWRWCWLLVLILLPLLSTGCQQSAAWIIGVPQVTPEAVNAASRGPTPPLILDVRPYPAFLAGHLPGATSAELGELDTALALQPLGQSQVFTVCDSGWQSLHAAAILGARGYSACAMEGGIDAWKALQLPTDAGPGAIITAAGQPHPRIPLSPLHQNLLLFSGFAIKPIYMLLSLILAIRLWKHPSPALRLIRWGFLANFVGELTCLTYHVALPRAVILPIIHDVGMFAMGGLIFGGIFQILDERVLRLSSPTAHCASQRFCGKCWKFDEVSCAIQRLFTFILPVMMVLACMPLTAPLRPGMNILLIKGPYNELSFYNNSPLLQIFLEFRLYPLLAVGLFAYTLVQLRRKSVGIERAQLTFFVGLGVMWFSMLRFLLSLAYQETPVYTTFWEELTEISTTMGAWLFLEAFKGPLGLWKYRPGPRLEKAAAAPDGPGKPHR